MNNQPFFQEIRQLIARDELPEALEKLQHVLGNDPKLTDAIHPSGLKFLTIFETCATPPFFTHTTPLP
jgi:hypothetical protein